MGTDPTRGRGNPVSRIRRQPQTPDRGDICWIDLDPPAGSKEIGKRRPCLVLTPKAYNDRKRLCVVVPISTELSDDPFCVGPARPSAIACDHCPGLRGIAS
jgi:hypothetical protein